MAVASQAVLLTSVAMIAFAANSLLCRLALGPGLIDPPSFATLRVLAGALTLGVIVLPRWRAEHRANTSFFAVAALLGYMICFSYAYVSLAAGTGALILFGTVQMTMFVAALRAGEPFPALAWIGLIGALAGLVYLVSPGLTAPDPTGTVLKTGAGLGWGLYSLSGRKAPDALMATAANFVWTLPGVAVVSLLTIANMNARPLGIAYAVASGAIASGLGYVVWFAAVKRLRATTAATVQLSVPIIAAFGGTLLLDEAVTPRLVVAAAATLGGIWLVLAQKGKTA